MDVFFIKNIIYQYYGSVIDGIVVYRKTIVKILIIGEIAHPTRQ